MTRVAWESGHWTHEPVSARIDGDALVVTAAEGTDAWRTTSYGFIHDTEHALLTPFDNGTAVEVSFTGDFSGNFDQAGVFIRTDDENWIKTGVEFSDRVLQLGAVVTRGLSDWSVAPVPHWAGRRITVRASRSGDAVAIRARVDDEPFALIRLAPLAPDAVAEAGPFLCAPSRAGLTVRFESWTVGPADESLH
jgi:regulation of enolase protein 1 (concanavalin A-like superfamily)